MKVIENYETFERWHKKSQKVNPDANISDLEVLLINDMWNLGINWSDSKAVYNYWREVLGE